MSRVFEAIVKRPPDGAGPSSSSPLPAVPRFKTTAALDLFTGYAGAVFTRDAFRKAFIRVHYAHLHKANGCNPDSSTLSEGSPAQFHDAVATMDPEQVAQPAPLQEPEPALPELQPAPLQEPQPILEQAAEPIALPISQQPPRETYTSHSHNDTLSGIEGSPNVANNGFASDSAVERRQHRMSQSVDHSRTGSPRTDELDASARYTPATTPASRPTSSLSSQAFPDPASRTSGSAPEKKDERNHVVIKVGMVGDAQIGKTSLMVKYVEGSWDEDYIQTLGVNFMEKTISIRNTEITFSIWDLGGQREFVNMLPLVCNDAVAILFMFDLTRKSTLNSIKEWYRQGRGFNKTAIPILVGTKYDHFVNFPREEQEEISNQARRFAKAMRAALIFSSTSHSINVQKIFKIVLSKAFDLKCTIPEIENVGEPLLLYQSC